MMTALCAVRNILGEKHDLWAINTEADYHEEKKEVSGKLKRPAYAEPLRVEKTAVPEDECQRFKGSTATARN
jgi:hypothetical protein